MMKQILPTFEQIVLSEKYYSNHLRDFGFELKVGKPVGALKAK